MASIGGVRIRAAAACAALLSLSHALAPDEPTRVAWLFAVIIPLAYGHLVGALPVVRAHRTTRRPRPSASRVAFAVGNVAVGFCVFSEFTAVLVPPLAALSVWHVIENDLALARATGGALPPLRRRAAVGLAFAMVAAGAAAFVPGPWLAHAAVWNDAVAFALGYHAFTWLWITRLRFHALASANAHGAARRARRVGAAHALPLAATLAAFTWPAAPGADAFLAVSTPAVFFYFSAVHVVQTAAARGVEPARRGPLQLRSA